MGKYLSLSINTLRGLSKEFLIKCQGNEAANLLEEIGFAEQGHLRCIATLPNERRRNNISDDSLVLCLIPSKQPIFLVGKIFHTGFASLVGVIDLVFRAHVEPLLRVPDSRQSFLFLQQLMGTRCKDGGEMARG